MSLFPSMGPAGAATGGGMGMGLLNDPRMAALLGASSGLLSAAGPTPQKVGMGGAMGAGMGGAMSGMIGAENMMADRQMQKMMMDFMRQQMGQGAQQPRPGGPMPVSPGPRAPASMPIAPMGHPAMQPQGAPASVAAQPTPPQFGRPMPRPPQFGRPMARPMPPQLPPMGMPGQSQLHMGMPLPMGGLY